MRVAPFPIMTTLTLLLQSWESPAGFGALRLRRLRSLFYSSQVCFDAQLPPRRRVGGPCPKYRIKKTRMAKYNYLDLCPHPRTA